jgi:hypothetical protein
MQKKKHSERIYAIIFCCAVAYRQTVSRWMIGQVRETLSGKLRMVTSIHRESMDTIKPCKETGMMDSCVFQESGNLQELTWERKLYFRS